MNIEDTFKSLGLTKKEASVYLALLELGEATVLTASKKSGIKRPTAYLVLRSLEEKGFISRVLKGKKIFFAPQHPRKLVTEAEVRLRELQGAMPQLESLLHDAEDRPRVKMYEGKEGADYASKQWFTIRGETVWIGTLKLSMEVFPRTFEEVTHLQFSKDFSSRELLDESEETRAYAERISGPYRRVRFMSKELLPFEADMGVFGNHTLITSVRKEYFTIDIESKEIANAFRTIFEVMWKAGKE